MEHDLAQVSEPANDLTVYTLATRTRQTRSLCSGAQLELTTLLHQVPGLGYRKAANKQRDMDIEWRFDAGSVAKGEGALRGA